MIVEQSIAYFCVDRFLYYEQWGNSTSTEFLGKCCFSLDVLTEYWVFIRRKDLFVTRTAGVTHEWQDNEGIEGGQESNSGQ